MGDMVVTVDTEVTVDTAMVDTVARDLLMLKLKLGVPLDTDTVPDMVLVDMEVMVSALSVMEVTVLDTVSGRDPLMPIPKLGEPLDTDTVPDTVLEDMEVTDTVDMLTESNFYISNNVLPLILISSHYTH